MKEEFLHFIWKNKLYNEIVASNLRIKIEILEKGIHNFNAGPDFFNAKIKIDKTVWAGNVEIHVKASDWENHGHHLDKAYNNVILHLVHMHDKDVFHQNGNSVMTAKINFDQDYLTKYKTLIRSVKHIACSDCFQKIDAFTVNSWLTNVLIERIESKTDYLKSLLEFTGNNQEEAFYISLAGSFGFKVNTEPFEWLAKSLPSLILAKNKNDRLKIEALLFGQSGFLDEEFVNDAYYNSLKKEYLFLKTKYQLKPIEKHLWKFLRIRPVNFPTIRIAQFASLVFKSSHLFSKILEIKTEKELLSLFEIEVHDYWSTHFVFGKTTRMMKKSFGINAVENIIINTVLPFLFLYGKEKNNEEFMNRALNFYEQFKPETNHIIKKWEDLGLNPKNAYESQALIELYNSYCMKRRCLECRIGGKLLMK
jgi:hypothetical protein